MYHGWPWPMTVEFTSESFQVPSLRNLSGMEVFDERAMFERVEPRMRALPRAVVSEVVKRDLGLRRMIRGTCKEGPGSETWPGMGSLAKGERLVLVDTETVFALAVYLGFEPEREMKSCSPLTFY